MNRWDAVPWELRYPGLKRPEPKPDPVARVVRALDQIGAAMQEQEQRDRRRANQQRLERLVTAVERANAKLDARSTVQERSQVRSMPALARADPALVAALAADDAIIRAVGRAAIPQADRLLNARLNGVPVACELPHRGTPPDATTVSPALALVCPAHATAAGTLPTGNVRTMPVGG